MINRYVKVLKDGKITLPKVARESLGIEEGDLLRVLDFKEKQIISIEKVKTDK